MDRRTKTTAIALVGSFFVTIVVFWFLPLGIVGKLFGTIVIVLLYASFICIMSMGVALLDALTGVNQRLQQIVDAAKQPMQAQLPEAGNILEALQAIHQLLENPVPPPLPLIVGHVYRASNSTKDSTQPAKLIVGVLKGFSKEPNVVILQRVDVAYRAYELCTTRGIYPLTAEEIEQVPEMRERTQRALEER